jgi:hypothetical protein
VGHIDGKAQRRLLRCSEGLKWSSCGLRNSTYGYLKVIVCSFEGVPHFG